MARRTGTLGLFAALLALLLALWAPAALAHHKDGHTQGGGKPSSESGSGDHDGGADSDPNTSYNEDIDGDGVDNDEDTKPSSHPSGKDRYEEPGGSGNQGKSESDPDDDGRGPERCEPVSSRNSGDGTCGADKPNGTGGEDIYDQDGNNGCGNDQDFDDDNEGWCGKPDRVKGDREDKKPTDVCDADLTMPGIQKCETPDEDEVGGIVIVDKPCPLNPVMGEVIPVLCEEDEGDDVGVDLEKKPAVPEDDDVLGVRVTAAPAAPAAVAPAAVAPAAVAAAPEAQGAVLPFTGASDLVAFIAIGLMLTGIGALSLRGRRSSA